MPRIRLLAATLAMSAVISGLAACANPDSGSIAEPSPAGGTVEVQKDDTVAAMVPQDFREAGTIVAAINADQAPIKFVDSEGEVDGLSPDVLRAAGEVMGIEVDFEIVPSDSMVTGLESQRYDLLASYGDFEERRAKIDFIDWLNAGTAIITSSDYPKDDIEPGVDLCGLTVGYVRAAAQEGLTSTASKECVKGGRDAIDVTPLGDVNAGLLAVQSGQADAFWGDAAPMAYNAKEKPDTFKVVFEQISVYYGIGINKENAELTKALQAALLKLAEDGVYEQLLERWGQTEYGVPEFPINAGGSLDDL